MDNFFDKIKRINAHHRGELEKLHTFILDGDIENLEFALEQYTGQALLDAYVVEQTAAIIEREPEGGSEGSAIDAERRELVDDLIVSTVEAHSGSSFQLFKREKYREAIALILRQVGTDWKLKGGSS